MLKKGTGEIFLKQRYNPCHAKKRKGRWYETVFLAHQKKGYRCRVYIVFSRRISSNSGVCLSSHDRKPCNDNLFFPLFQILDPALLGLRMPVSSSSLTRLARTRSQPGATSKRPSGTPSTAGARVSRARFHRELEHSAYGAPATSGSPRRSFRTSP